MGNYRPEEPRFGRATGKSGKGGKGKKGKKGGGKSKSKSKGKKSKSKSKSKSPKKKGKGAIAKVEASPISNDLPLNERIKLRQPSKKGDLNLGPSN
jgi:hypothetical protein